MIRVAFICFFMKPCVLLTSVGQAVRTINNVKTISESQEKQQISCSISQKILLIDV